MENDERQVQISFSTSLGDDLRVSDAPLVVPVRLSRQGLSEVINHLLDLSKPRPFDFLVNGTLLRSSLGVLLAKKDLSLEQVIEIEYFLISDSPNEGPEHLHKDWVSSVAGSDKGHVASGCYDAAVRVWAPNAEKELELHGHKQAVSSIALADNRRCVSASLDNSVRVWGLAKGGGSLEGCAKLLGHTAGVSCVCVRGERIVSASADKTLKLWALPSSEELAIPPQGPASKRAPGARKSAKVGDNEEGQESGDSNTKTRGCLATFVAHTQPVTGAGWGDDGQVWSGSWDHSVRCWDIETQQDIVTLSGGHAVSGLAVSSEGSAEGEGKRARLVASGHTDRVVRVWDPRSSQAALVAHSLHSHKGWVTAVAWSGRNEWELASASLDSTVKLWDIRSSIPQHTIKAHQGKVLCVTFCKSAAGGLQLVSGGEDGKMRTFTF